MKKRMLSILLCCVMLLGLLPTAAAASLNSVPDFNYSKYFFHVCGIPSAQEAEDNYFLFYFQDANYVLAGGARRSLKSPDPNEITYEGPARVGKYDKCIIIGEGGLRLEAVTEKGQTYFYIRKSDDSYYKRKGSGTNKSLATTKDRDDATQWQFVQKDGAYLIKEKGKKNYWNHDIYASDFSITEVEGRAVTVTVCMRENPTFVRRFSVSYHDKRGLFGFKTYGSDDYDIETGAVDIAFDAAAVPIRITIPCFAMKGFKVSNIWFFHKDVWSNNQEISGGREPGDYLDTARPDIVFIKAYSREGPSGRTDTTDIKIEVRYERHVTRSGRPMDGSQELPDSDYDVIVPGNCSKTGTRVLICEKCGLEVFRDTQSYGAHNWGKATYIWNEDHSECTATRKCSINSNHKENASATVSLTETPPTCTSGGTRTYTAAFDAGWAKTQTYTEKISEADADNHTGTLGDWQMNESEHWKEYSCCHAKSENAEHVYTDDADTTCDICDYIRTVAPSHTHVWADEWSSDDTHHWHACTADGCDITDDAQKDGYAAHSGTDDGNCTTAVTCECGYEITAAKAEHSYPATWTAVRPGTSHTRSCQNEGCGVTRSENCTGDGTATCQQFAKCTVCGGDVGTKADHDFTAETTDEEYLKSAVTCTAKAVYYKSCSVCGLSSQGMAGEATFESGEADADNHTGTLGDWQMNESEHWKEYSCCRAKTEEAEHVYDDDSDAICNTCGYVRTIVPSHTHDWAAAWDNNDTHHWHECTADGCDITDNAQKDGYAAHVYDNDADATCNTCGYIRSVTPDTYTVIFDANGGTVQPASMVTNADGTLENLPTPTRGGSYRFAGWYTEKRGGTRITTDSVFTADTTVYAHWTYTGSSGSDVDLIYYTLTFNTNGGSAIASERFRSGAAVDLSGYTPSRRGYTFTGWYSDKSLTDRITAIRMNGNKTVYAGWQKQKDTNPFVDVSESDWFYDDVTFDYERELMLGTGDTMFSPYGAVTRAMMAAILWRMEGSPAPASAPDFTDVASGKWYSDAIAWTTENGVYLGYGNGRFGPDDLITREQLAAVFCRYAACKGGDVRVKGAPDTFADQEKVSAWAQDAMKWAVASGLMQGRNGNVLDPQGTATRAEVAAMLRRFAEK